MRTTISKVNDIKNNETRTYEKIKPDVNLLRGITTVELFDAETGEKSYEVETENFVTPLLDDARENWSRLSYFSTSSTLGEYEHNSTSDSRYSYIRVDSNNSGMMCSTHYNTIFDKTPFAQVPQMWKHLVLTDYDGEEKPKYERHKKGKLIGYANTISTSGSDSSTRGFVNKTDSQLSVAKPLKFVFDFGTHAANGTIRSIYFSETTDVNNRDNRYMFEYKTGLNADEVINEENSKLGYYVLSDINIFEEGSRCFLGYKNKKLYFIAFNEETEEIIETKELKFTASRWKSWMTLSKISVGKNSNGEYIVGAIDGYLKFDSNGVYLNQTYNTYYTPTATGYIYNKKDNCFTYVSTKHNRVYYLCMSSSETSSNYIYVYNTLDNNRISSFTFSQRNKLYSTPTIKEIDIDTIVVYGAKLSQDGTSRDTSYRYKLANTTRTTESVNPSEIEEQVNDITFKEIEGFEHLFDPFHHTYKAVGDVTTRNLLPEPIVKTSDYTMKITYELRFE